MKVISSAELRNNMKKYLDLARGYSKREKRNVHIDQGTAFRA